MKVSEYIVDFIIKNGVTEAFGYPGGSVTELVEAFRKRSNEINAHVTYHEQGAAFAACGYAEVTQKIGVTYATGGPGCTNLLTGIGQAYYDSIPLLCITGNVNTYESRRELGIRQRGFQESDNIGATTSFTKYSAYIERAEDIRYHIERAYHEAMIGRRGPVHLDIPMDVLKAEIEAGKLKEYQVEKNEDRHTVNDYRVCLTDAVISSKAPCVVIGNGIKGDTERKLVRELANKWDIPFISSMISFDILGDCENYYGFIGAYGNRTANFILSKCDLVISVGNRLDSRQTGVKRENFAPNAKIIRADIDGNELNFKLKADKETGFCLEAEEALKIMNELPAMNGYSHWNEVCRGIKSKLKGIDKSIPNDYISQISEYVPENTVITADVGQNEVWLAQSFRIKNGQKVLFSGGFGSMGYALPAAIGACHGSEGSITVCVCGDGGMQMNIQELQYVFREQLPIKIVVFNNNSLGMIRHFQEMYFDGEYFQTKPEGGYTTCDFAKIANAYGIESVVIDSISQISKLEQAFRILKPMLIEIRYFEDTYIIPKLKFGNPNNDQEPLIDRGLYKEIMDMK